MLAVGDKGYEGCEFNYLFASWHRLPITFANSLDPDQARQNVRPDLDLN